MMAFRSLDRQEPQGVVVDDALAVSEPEEVEEAPFSPLFAPFSTRSTRFSADFRSISVDFELFSTPRAAPWRSRTRTCSPSKRSSGHTGSSSRRRWRRP